jgi:hypothetical protein
MLSASDIEAFHTNGFLVVEDVVDHQCLDTVRAPRLLDVVEPLIGGEITSNPIQYVRIKPPARVLVDGEARARLSERLHIAIHGWQFDSPACA